MPDFKLRLAAQIRSVDLTDFDRHGMAELLFNVAADEAGREKLDTATSPFGAWKIEMIGNDGLTKSERRSTRRGLSVPYYY